jgi:hypothetical protein
VPDNRHKFLFAGPGSSSRRGSCEQAVAALQQELDTRGFVAAAEDDQQIQQVSEAVLGTPTA